MDAETMQPIACKEGINSIHCGLMASVYDASCTELLNQSFSTVVHQPHLGVNTRVSLLSFCFHLAVGNMIGHALVIKHTLC